jgi:hypothetical protein
VHLRLTNYDQDPAVDEALGNDQDDKKASDQDEVDYSEDGDKYYQPTMKLQQMSWTTRKMKIIKLTSARIQPRGPKIATPLETREIEENLPCTRCMFQT